MNMRFLYCDSFRGRNRFFFEGDKGGGSGGGEPKAEGPKTLAEAKELLTAANGRVADAEARATKAEQERDAAQAEVEKLRGQFDSATEAAATAQRERDEARTERDAALGVVTKVTGERDQARKELATEQQNVERLEKLCGVKGVDPNAAVPPQQETSTKDEKINALRDEIAKCDDPKKKYELAQELKKLRAE